jgi:autotransporter-associated beta strand protein
MGQKINTLNQTVGFLRSAEARCAPATVTRWRNTSKGPPCDRKIHIHFLTPTAGAPRRASLRAVLLATSALASVAVPITVAHAGPIDATWLATQPAFGVPGDFNNANHWIGSDGIAVPTGIATFNASNIQAITFNDTTTLGGITVNPNAGNYTFTNNAGLTLTFNGAGLSVGSGSSLQLINNGRTDFVGNNSTAGQANITNNDLLYFRDKSSAAQSVFTNHGNVIFLGSSTAGDAFIQSDGTILFLQQSRGETARIKLDNGTLDISGLVTAGTTVGSIEGSGNVFLGSRNLALIGGNEPSTVVFSGVIQDGVGGVGGSLTKEGKSALTLTGNNTYTGGTDVNQGALIVDGSIERSSSVTVNAGGTLAGTGNVPVTIVDGGTLAPGHSDGSFGTLTVRGDLLFTTTAGTTYLVQVSPANATSTSVTGSATFNGATVQANFAPGTYITKQYGILHADGGVNDTFNPLAKTNLSSMFKTTLSYDANDVFLNLSAAAPDANAAGLNTNQRNVTNALVNSFNLMSGIPGAFATLTPAGKTQVSGETAVGTQQATFDAMNQFMGVMLDPTVGGRGGAQANDAYASMARKAPEAFDARWGAWAAGFGGSQSTSGDAALGSNKTTSNVFGSAAGADYRFSPNTVAGFALAGGGTHFSVANGGSGNSDLFQAGAYLRHTQGAAFIAAALAYGWQDVTTNRTVTVAGIDSLRGRFNANAISGRLEGGYKVATQAGVFTPYAAGQFTSYHLPSYTEQAASGANTFALSYNGKDVTATRSELGVKAEKAVALTDATLMLRGRLARGARLQHRSQRPGDFPDAAGLGLRRQRRPAGRRRRLDHRLRRDALAQRLVGRSHRGCPIVGHHAQLLRQRRRPL